MITPLFEKKKIDGIEKFVSLIYKEDADVPNKYSYVDFTDANPDLISQRYKIAIGIKGIMSITLFTSKDGEVFRLNADGSIDSTYGILGLK